jgi:hypothetical protein
VWRCVRGALEHLGIELQGQGLIWGIGAGFAFALRFALGSSGEFLYDTFIVAFGVVVSLF